LSRTSKNENIYIDLHSKFDIEIQYIMYYKIITHMRNLFFENLNYLIVRIFLMVKIWPYFHKFIWVTIFVCFSISLSQKHIFWKLYMGHYSYGLCGFLFKIAKLKNDINYIKYKFSHRFGKVCGWLNMYYSKIKILTFKKVTTMFIWIILKNLIWAYRECNFCRYWVTIPCIHRTLFTHLIVGG